MNYTADLKKPERHFLPEGFVLTDWKNLEPWFQDLERRPLETRPALEKWLLDMSELEEAFNYFCLEIQPKIQPYADRLNKRLVENPHTQELDPKEYFTYLRSVR